MIQAGRFINDSSYTFIFLRQYLRAGLGVEREVPAERGGGMDGGGGVRVWWRGEGRGGQSGQDIPSRWRGGRSGLGGAQERGEGGAQRGGSQAAAL